MKSDSSFAVSAWAVLASLALNAGAFWGVDKAVGIHSSSLVAELAEEREAARAAADEQAIALDFIESTPVPAAPPENSTRVSDRDAANRDEEGNGPGDGPKLQETGIDQLEQNRSSAPPSPPPAPAIQPEPEQIAMPQASEEPPAPEETQAAAEPPTEGDVVVPPEPSPAPATVQEPLAEAQQPREAREARPAVQPTPPAALVSQPTAKIITRQMSRTKALGASLQGMTSFEATGSGMGVYMKELKEKIWLAWFPYLAFKYPTDFAMADTVLAIVIGKDGRLRSVRLVESRGTNVFADFCIESVQRAAPFRPLPEELLALLPKDELEIYFAFHYM